MKNLLYAITLCLLLSGCEKYESGKMNQVPVNKRTLTREEVILKQNLDQTARVLADVIQDEAVNQEITIMSNGNRTFYSLYFKDLFDETKSISGSFINLRNKFLDGCAQSGSKGDWSDLANYLAKNDCYIYCPYPSSFYPKGTNSFTVAAHPIDNDIENKGYRFEGNKIKVVTVNEQYSDNYMVLLVMPRNEDNDDLIGMNLNSIPTTKADPVYEVRIGKVRCADYCGGLFEGTLELRITRGYPEYNLTTNELKASFSTVIPIDYPRDYAKAAINNWTVHSNGGWFASNNIWDSNWRPEKKQQCILAYEYDKVNEVSVGATVGYKADNLSPALTVSAKTTYKGDFLGLVEWDRDWFFATNSNPGIYDEVKDGWVVRKTCPDFKLTTPLRIIY